MINREQPKIHGTVKNHFYISSFARIGRHSKFEKCKNSANIRILCINRSINFNKSHRGREKKNRFKSTIPLTERNKYPGNKSRANPGLVIRLQNLRGVSRCIETSPRGTIENWIFSEGGGGGGGVLLYSCIMLHRHPRRRAIYAFCPTSLQQWI